MMPARSFEDVDIWHEAHEFVLDVYRLTEGFPRHELYGLTSQLRRAAVSIPANSPRASERFRDRTNYVFTTLYRALSRSAVTIDLARDLNYGDTEALRLKA